MSATLCNFSSVANWLASLSVSGVTIRSLSAIPQVIQPQDCPVLVPDVGGEFVTNLAIERLSGFTATYGRTWHAGYTLTYVLYHTPAQEGTRMFNAYADMLDSAQAVINAVLQNETPTGAHDIAPAGLLKIGAVTDLSGTVFHGARMAFAVTEFS